MSDVVAINTALASTTICGGITGIRRAYDLAPSGVDLPLPCVIITPHEGTISGGEHESAPEMFGTRMTVHQFKLQVLVSLQSDLQDAERTARPYLSRFVTTIDRWKTLNNTANVIDATVSSYRYGLIELRKGDPNYLGFELIAKVLEIETGGTLYGSTGPTA